MYLAVVSSKFAVSSNGQELHGRVTNIPTSTTKLEVGQAGRRGLLLSSTATTIVAAALAVESNDSQTALLQKYLKKSEENKEKNDKERLDNYYKRNYKDYFGFVEGTLRAKDEKELSESEKGILEWLDKNK
ncbi:uncharacterized protein LOC141649786 [Silene latifolia]|uniref:uncharacterized protein LOC141649786 n=1 Tax=Silene latifolia TaxID=37657 RepID=UPI003D7751E3